MIDIVAVGELLIDFTPAGKNVQGIDLLAQNPGGAPANVLAMNAKLGGRAAFIGKVGKDHFGTYLQSVLLQQGIDASGLVLDPAFPTTLAFVHLDGKGERSFTFYRDPGADQRMATEDLRLDLIDRCRVFHFGSVSLTHDPSRSATLYGAKYAGQKGKLVSFDPNYRPMLWDNDEEAKLQIEEGILCADIVKVSEEEMEFITGTKDLESGSERLLEMGPALVLVSLGEKGAYYRNSSACGHVPSYPVKAVDTTGAGDAFVGALLWKVQEMTREELSLFPSSQLEEIVRFSNAAGALTTTGRGAMPAMPNGEQIRRLIEEG